MGYSPWGRQKSGTTYQDLSKGTQAHTRRVSGRGNSACPARGLALAGRQHPVIHCWPPLYFLCLFLIAGRYCLLKESGVIKKTLSFWGL